MTYPSPDDIRGLLTELNDARNAVRIYGDHLASCERRPCSCGFQKAWEDHAAKAIHPGKTR